MEEKVVSIKKYGVREPITINKLNFWKYVKINNKTAISSEQGIYKITCGGDTLVVKIQEVGENKVFTTKTTYETIAMATYFGEKYPKYFIATYGFDYVPDYKVPKEFNPFIFQGVRKTTMTAMFTYMEAGVSDLSKWLETKRTTKEYIRMLKAVLNILSILDSEGVVHNDFHERNVLVTKDGSFKLIDFDLIRISLNNEGSDSSYFFKELYEHNEYRGWITDKKILDLLEFLYANRDVPIQTLREDFLQTKTVRSLA